MVINVAALFFPTFFFHFLFKNEINIRAEENLVNEWNIKKKRKKNMMLY